MKWDFLHEHYTKQFMIPRTLTRLWTKGAPRYAHNISVISDGQCNHWGSASMPIRRFTGADCGHRYTSGRMVNRLKKRHRYSGAKDKSIPVDYFVAKGLRTRLDDSLDHLGWQLPWTTFQISMESFMNTGYLCECARTNPCIRHYLLVGTLYVHPLTIACARGLHPACVEPSVNICCTCAFTVL